MITHVVAGGTKGIGLETALAVASTGLSFGGLSYTIFASWLIDDRGLADAAPFLAGLFLVSVAIAMPGLWPWPATRGLTPFGEPPATDGPPEGIDYDTAISTRFFRIIVVGFILVGVVCVVGAAIHRKRRG